MEAYGLENFHFREMRNGEAEVTHFSCDAGSLAAPCCVQVPALWEGRRVTAIGEEAFSGCESLTEVLLPEGVTVIGKRAFCGCAALTEIVLPDSVAEMGDSVF